MDPKIKKLYNDLKTVENRITLANKLIDEKNIRNADIELEVLNKMLPKLSSLPERI